MKYPKNSTDYEVNLVAYWEMIELIPLTKTEFNAFRNWALAGNDVEDNPWHFLDDDGCPMNFVKAYRIYYGASHGPWDTWDYCDPEELETYR